MAFTIADRIKDTSTTEGEGTLTLSGTAATGFKSFGDGVGDGNSTFYVIEDGTNFEVGVGKYTHSGTTLARSTVIASSDGGDKIDWSAGTRDVFVSDPSVASLYSTRVETGTTYVAAVTDSVILCGNSSNMALTLPTASELTIGLRYQVQKIGDNAALVTISDGASAQVDHGTTLVLYLQGDMVELVCAYDGTGYEWLALSSRLKKHSAALRQTSSQSPSGGAEFTVAFDSVDFEYGADADAGNEYIEIQRAGVYDCFAALSLSNITSDACFAYVSVNGEALADAKAINSTSRVGNNFVSGSVLLELANSDQVRCLGYHLEMGGVSTIVSSERLQPRLQVSEV